MLQSVENVQDEVKGKKNVRHPLHSIIKCAISSHWYERKRNVTEKNKVWKLNALVGKP